MPATVETVICARCHATHTVGYACDCIEAGSCGHLAASECVACASCPACCRCRTATGLPEFRQHATLFHRGRKTAEMPSSRTVSAEIEFFRGGAGVSAVLDNWQASCVRDGSVADGAEINTAPASGSEFVKQLTEVSDFLLATGAKVDSRCGLHVHVDAGDFDYRAHVRLLWLWAIIEESMYSLVPASREYGIYACKREREIRAMLPAPCALTADEAQAAVFAIVRGGADNAPYLYAFNTTEEYNAARAAYDAANAKGVPYLRAATLKEFAMKKVAGKVNPNPKDGSTYGRRYFGLNVKAAFEHGTIEFRLHGGTVESQKIIAWGAICASILDYAKTAKIEDLTDLWVMPESARWDFFLANIVPPAHWAYAIQRRAKFAAQRARR